MTHRVPGHTRQSTRKAPRTRLCYLQSGSSRPLGKHVSQQNEATAHQILQSCTPVHRDPGHTREATLMLSWFGWKGGNLSLSDDPTESPDRSESRFPDATPGAPATSVSLQTKEKTPCTRHSPRRTETSKPLVHRTRFVELNKGEAPRLLF